MGDRWATWDCYGTLIDWNEGIGTVLGRVFGESERARLLDRYHEVEPEVQAERYRIYREVLDLVLARLAAEEGRELSDDERTAMSESLKDWPAFPEVPDKLHKLVDRGWNLVILSNCDRDLLAQSLPRLEAPFERVIVAEDVRSYKPAHGHWDAFFSQTNAPRDRYVHVAQSQFHDIVVADELGLPSVWVNRLGETAQARPTREVPDLNTLPDVLDELVAP